MDVVCFTFFCMDYCFPSVHKLSNKFVLIGGFYMDVTDLARDFLNELELVPLEFFFKMYMYLSCVWKFLSSQW